MLFQLNLVFAVLFGLGSPLLVVVSPSLRWWLVWFLLGMVLFAWPVAAVFTTKSDSLVYGLRFGVIASLVMAACAVFLVSFLARGYWLARRRASPPVS
jgi:hypothetical protein